MNVREIWNVIRRNWYLIAATTVAAVAFAALFTLVQTPKFEATAKVFVSTQSSSTVAELSQGNTFTQSAVKSFADVITTPLVLDPVISQLSLGVPSDELAESVRATTPLDTAIIEITAIDTSARGAAELANAISASFADAVAGLVPESADGTAQVRISVLAEAAPPEAPSSPDVPVTVALAALLGALGGIGITYLRRALDTRVRGIADVESVTDLPILGGIPQRDDADIDPLVVATDPTSPPAEAYRRIRANLRFLAGDEESHVYVVTSAIAGEGKTSTSVNLAIALASGGVTTCLVDADLRRPTVAKKMGIEGAVGLSDVLVGTVRLVDALQPWGDADLFVLPSGSRPPNAGELVSSDAMAELIAALGSQFDTVVIDAPPVLPVADAAVMSRLGNGAIVVASAQSVTKTQLRQALGSLAGSGAHTRGVVLTKVPQSGAAAYGYGSYTYTYESVS